MGSTGIDRLKVLNLRAARCYVVVRNNSITKINANTLGTAEDVKHVVRNSGKTIVFSPAREVAMAA